MPRRSVAAVLLAFILAGCSAVATAPPVRESAPFLSSIGGVRAGDYIKHIVIVVQENRSFDNIFSGFSGADSATYGYTSSGKKVRLGSINFNSYNPDHDWKTAMTAYNGGKMNGFDRELIYPRVPDYAYAHLAEYLVGPYWNMARQYVLADHMFPTMFGGSFTGHLTLVAGTARVSAHTSVADFPSGVPWGCDAPRGTVTPIVDSRRKLVQGAGPFPCYDSFHTLAETLDAARVSWKYYSPSVFKPTLGGNLWSAFDAIAYVREGRDWKAHVVSPQTRILTDPGRGALPDVAWVVPDWADSDHPGSGSSTGPSWVASIVNAVGESKYWKSSAVIVVWDDWGGWYDHVPPPQLDYRGLGIRVPCIIVSPYVARGHVSHTTYEFGSILKFVEQMYGLPPIGDPSLGYTDTRANSLVDAFDFAQKPRAFQPLPVPYPPSYFLHRKPSLQPVDEQ